MSSRVPQNVNKSVPRRDPQTPVSQASRPTTPSHGLNPASLMALQRSIGNAKVSQLLRGHVASTQGVVQRSEEVEQKLIGLHVPNGDAKTLADGFTQEYEESSLSQIAEAVVTHKRTAQETLDLLAALPTPDDMLILAAVTTCTVPSLLKVAPAVKNGRSSADAAHVLTNCPDLDAADVEWMLRLPSTTSAAHITSLSNDLCPAGQITGEKASSMIKALQTKCTDDDITAFVHGVRATGLAAALLETLAGGAGFAEILSKALSSGWNTASFGSFIGTALKATAQAAGLQTLLENDFVADLYNMITAGWTASQLGAFLGTAVESGMAADALQKLVKNAGFPASSLEMLNATWAPDSFGTFVAALHAATLNPDQIQELLSTNGIPASSASLIGTGLSPVQVAQFLAAVRLAGVTASNVQAMLATGGMIATLGGVITGGWAAVSFGTFIGHALNAGVLPGTLQTFLALPGLPALVQAMLVASWTANNLGLFLGEVLNSGIAGNQVKTLLSQGNFPAASYAMLTAGWSASELAKFAASASASGLAPANLGGLINTPGFNASSYALITAGLTPLQVGQLSASARAAGMTAANLQGFLSTPNAATACMNLIATWGAAQIGQTIAHVRAQAGAPTDAETVDLLDLSHTHNWAAASVRSASGSSAVGGTLSWAAVIGHAPTFVGQPGPRGHGGTGGATLNSVTFTRAPGGGVAPYNVRLNIRQERVFHVENGHTFEHFEFTYANCTRDVRSSLYPAGTDVEAMMIPLPANPAAQNIADQAAWAGVFQGLVGTDRVGVQQFGATFIGGGGRTTYPTYINQMYPTGGGMTQIYAAELVAIGRLLGHAI
ncbi:hypothetical protein JJB07_18080 [Tumebacillus sp. ITR2]|uniref:Phage tail tape measure protein domain-containing protein n=1 Tax=Tumebacillus amylolyticus TaxID=2801339 RepID=A0ABS1JE84_9BACL|nr:hypothetical protein [Tumebacillus amylolyticus]MBL0388515.1 hypothetical protein [Tumebacillus amylolyticus]